jgi:hypothetical protein
VPGSCRQVGLSCLFRALSLSLSLSLSLFSLSACLYPLCPLCFSLCLSLSLSLCDPYFLSVLLPNAANRWVNQQICDPMRAQNGGRTRTLTQMAAELQSLAVGPLLLERLPEAFRVAAYTGDVSAFLESYNQTRRVDKERQKKARQARQGEGSRKKPRRAATTDALACIVEGHRLLVSEAEQGLPFPLHEPHMREAALQLLKAMADKLRTP